MNTQTSLFIDILLTLGFGVQHSLLAMFRTKARVRKWVGIEPLAWRSVESLVNVCYILLAAAAWQRIDVTIWDIRGLPGMAMLAVTCASWLWYWQLHLFEYDCGLAFGSTTLVARLAQEPSPKLVPWKIGTRRWLRFPVHTAFFGMFLCLPHMTADALALGIVINIYNVVGSVLYDKRLEKLAPKEYGEYIKVTGLIWPPIYRAPEGAKSVTMPEPLHWRRPSMHVPGLVLGFALGLLYFWILGDPGLGVATSAKAAGAGILGSVLVGGILGRICKPTANDWGQQQTDLSTTVALAAATGVLWWVMIVWYRDGTPPNFAYYLPLWFTVQYLGHVFAVLADLQRWAPARRNAGYLRSENIPQVSS
jgi:hypothetical protein